MTIATTLIAMPISPRMSAPLPIRMVAATRQSVRSSRATSFGERRTLSRWSR